MMGVPGGRWMSIMGGSSQSSAAVEAALSNLFIAIERGRARAAESRRDESSMHRTQAFAAQQIHHGTSLPKP
jgi:hypothetical protein